MKSNQSSYRWVIATLCFMMFFLAVGLGNMPKTLYIVPVTENLNISRGDFSLVFSIITITSLLTNLLYGYLEEHWGVRILASLGLILMAIGYFFFSRAFNLRQFYIGAVIVGFGFPLCTITSVSVLINNWFNKKQQGVMLGLVVAGSGFGGSLFSIIIGKHIITHGTSASYLLTSIILALSAFPIFFFTRSEPRDETISADGKSHSIDSKLPIENTQDLQLPMGKSPGLFKQSYTWFTLIAVFLIGITVAPTNDNMPPFLIEKGFSIDFIITIASAIFLVQALAKILLGLINDRMGAQYCLLTGLGSYVIGTVTLILSKSVWNMWLYVIFAGISMSSLAVLVPLYVRAIIGRENYGKLIGIFMATLAAGIGVGNPLINFIYDLTSTYRIILSILTGVGIAAFFFSYKSLKMAAKFQHSK